jgi:serine/threonine protein phosphatase PrpC
MKDFETATGSVIGRNHREKGLNNQDFSGFYTNDELVVGIVSDGCGSSSCSEIGAYLGCNILMDQIVNKYGRMILSSEIETHDRAEYLFKEIQCGVLRKLSNILETLPFSRLSEKINEAFLFTLVGFVITPDVTITFSIGDGFIFLNETCLKIENPISDDDQFLNAPPYISYGLLKTSVYPKSVDFTIHHHLPTENVNSLLVATDGLDDFIKNENSCIPGQKKLVGPVSQFWTDDQYFKLKTGIQRHLIVVNRDRYRAELMSQSTQLGANVHTKHDARLVKELGLLTDDTTLISVRRKQNNES